MVMLIHTTHLYLKCFAEIAKFIITPITTVPLTLIVLPDIVITIILLLLETTMYMFLAHLEHQSQKEQKEVLET